MNDSLPEFIPLPYDTIVDSDDPFLASLDSLMSLTYCNHFCYSTDTSLLNICDYEPKDIPEFSDEIMMSRFKELNAKTPIELSYNHTVQQFIDLYTRKGKGTTSRMLGMSHMYFPLFEESLAKYNLPLELKYLSIVESALNNTAKSHAGAAGLWQFMVATGKMYDLEVNSYIDERLDPWKSTDAACRYLKDLYELYDDWLLALAAYNAGPGNVNKAIRRSGGKMTFWEIKKHLPKETQGYVPAFLAVNYVMNFASEHNIYPVDPAYEYFELDTIHVHEKLRFDQIAHFTDLTEEEIVFLNPSYTKMVIPETETYYVLNLTIGASGLFVSNEEKVYEYKKEEEPVLVEETKKKSSSDSHEGKKLITYKVRNGDVLGVIADRYDVGLSQLKGWNGLRGSRIYPGQKLKIYVDDDTDVAESKKSTNSSKVTQDSNFQYHTVRNGDTLWDIAKLYDGVNYDEIRELNSGINVKRLKQGQKIKIKKLS